MKLLKNSQLCCYKSDVTASECGSYNYLASLFTVILFIVIYTSQLTAAVTSL